MLTISVKGSNTASAESSPKMIGLCVMNPMVLTKCHQRIQTKLARQNGR
jgi:hypothetical protein